MITCYQSPVLVPFGNPDMDIGLKGSHDETYGASPNMPVLCITPGVISDMSSPDWGKQIGILLDTPIVTPVGTKKWFHYLHLSAINPILKPGVHVDLNTILGWVGGGNKEADYLGTSNPTKKNFYNSANSSSHIQVGVAIMDGPAYGGPGWMNFPVPLVPWSPEVAALNPRPIVDAFVKRVVSFNEEWSSGGVYRTETGIANAAYLDYLTPNFHGCPVSQEYKIGNKIGQRVNKGIWIWDGTAHYYPYY